jgi:4-hydroxyphenylpyruvate dioxygenase-like putative hemolysin
MNSSDLQRIQHIRTYCEDIAKTIKRFGDGGLNVICQKW